MNQDISYPYPISAPIPNATHSHYTEKSRLSLLRSSDDEPISDSDQHHNHQTQHSHSEKGKHTRIYILFSRFQPTQISAPRFETTLLKLITGTCFTFNQNNHFHIESIS